MTKKSVEVTEEMRAEIRGAWAEIDLEQMKIISKMTIAERAERGFDMCESVMQVAIYRLRLKNPELSPVEARRQFLEDYYKKNPSVYLPQ